MKKKNTKKNVLVIIVAVIAAVMAFCAVLTLSGTVSFIEPTTTEAPTTEAPTTDPPPPHITSTATIRSAGDVLIHVPIYNAAKTAEGYSFDNVFTYTESLIEDCDYFVANLETTLAGTGKPYSGFPRFNSPDAIADALKKAGVDCLLTANNHTFDKNGEGVLRTQKVLKEKGITYTGTRETEESRKFIIAKVNDIKFGIICYTYETPSSEGRKSLNGLLVDTATAPLINSFKPSDPAPFYDDLKEQMKKMKKKGADVITVYLHWGEEYQLSPNNKQKEIAQKLCDMGVDVIIGGHPHVVQPVDLLTSENGKHKTVCVYSMGNVLSNQRRAYMGLKSGHTEDGLTFEMTFSKYSDGKVVFESVKSIPTWVHVYSSGGKKVYNIVPLSKNMDNKAEKLGLDKTADGLSQAKASYERTMALVKEGTDKCNKYLKAKDRVVN
ncbi:MAG: CapA family protein [Clostridia bacterium]|nr:CapA family protein [Clostridia bacterium]